MGEDLSAATTVEDAREVIEGIAQRKGTFTDAFKRKAREEAKNGRKETLQVMEGSEEIREDLSKLLRIVSNDLYTSRTRFLMEIIQNADDNKYTQGKMPTVSIAIFPGHIIIECNEEGFSKENVQALCRVGLSSKPPGQGYTGQKGIGFKSVFKIANRAHIRSPPYYFELDQKRDLGMITPQWDKEFFNNYAEEYQTTIVLDRICDQSVDFSTALDSDVRAIEPVLILFLRRIERFHLRLFKSSSDSRPATSMRFRRQNSTTNSGVVSLINEDTNVSQSLYKHRFTIGFNETESRRPDTKETDIALAFPLRKIAGKYVPFIQDQNLVFAYLPLGDFGFKFVIQADFLTTSSRQSVDEDSHWNRNIAKKIPSAFEAAVHNFNKGSSELGELATQWPLYLSKGTLGRRSYWNDIKTSIYQHLRGAKVIKVRTGSFREPKYLRILKWAQDRYGRPMFGHVDDYISEDYPSLVYDALLLLGVTVPTWEWVCDELKKLHDEDLLHKRMLSKEWCSDLANVILTPQKTMDNGSYARDLRRIPLIPLADGTWRCPPPEDTPIYFPASSRTAIPPGISLSIVNEEACACPKRRKLFKLLGVKVCDVTNVVERVLDYHAKFNSLEDDHLIAQIKYLYEMREYLRSGDMKKVYFVCPPSKRSKKGISIYADISHRSELQQYFSGYSQAYFLENEYFDDFSDAERSDFIKWLSETAGVALYPRFISSYSSRLHEDFKWLMANKSDLILKILRQYWDRYKTQLTNVARDTLADHEITCKSGEGVALHKTYIPFPELLGKTKTFGNAHDCQFLTLPHGDSKDWTFLSKFGVGLDDGLDFHLWVLKQKGFEENNNDEKSKRLYLAIQAQTFSPTEKEKVKKAFDNTSVYFPNQGYETLKNCVWQGPTGFLSKPALRPVYGPELNRLFRNILNISNVTSAEALEYLEQLKDNQSTTMTEATEVYVYLREHCADTFRVDDKTACIAVKYPPASALEWKTPADCVWDDEEFSQNELKLESKTTIRHTIEQHAPTAKAFFTDVLKLPNAGIDELLADLVLMQKQQRDERQRVYRLYERIESGRRSRPDNIRKAFKECQLVFIRGTNNQRSRWISLDDCIWTRSVLRHKYALMPSLNEFKKLFRETLAVPNATMDMLITDLLESVGNAPGNDEGEYQYVKELLQEIARLRQNDDEQLERLIDQQCWPCRTPEGRRELCFIGKFYVNNRQDLFDIFSDTFTFLDFNFNSSKKLTDLLRSQNCEEFLSENVVMETRPCEPLQYDDDLTRDFRGRANALSKYFERGKCKSPYELHRLLQNAKIWKAAGIKTCYKLCDNTVTKSEGGLSVKVSAEEGQTDRLEIFVSADKAKRDCALITDFPGQLVEALELEADNLGDLQTLLLVPLDSINALLIRKGITSGDVTDDLEESSVAETFDEDFRYHSHDGQNDNAEGESTVPMSNAFSDSTGSTVVDSTHAPAMSEATNITLRTNVLQNSSSVLSTPLRRSQNNQSVSSDDSPRQRLVTPRPAAAGLYSENNRNRNTERIQSFARNMEFTSRSRVRKSNYEPTGGAFDMSELGEGLEDAGHASQSRPVEVNSNSHRRAGLFFNRNEEERARDFEVGFLGEQFVYTMLHDKIKLPDFTGESNWTSTLRERAGFSRYGREVSDFTYKDTRGVLTHHFQQMEHPYETPDWLFTACSNGNVPLYRLEVKSTTSQNPTTAFYMSGKQHELAKKLQVTKAAPREIYVVLRISGLDALEDGAGHLPKWTVYLDPYTLGGDGVLNFYASTYAVTAVVP